MIIGIDATKAARAERTGVEELTYQLILHLTAQDNANKYLLYTDRSLPGEILRGQNLTQILAPLPRFWRRFRFPLALLRQRPDVLLIPGYTPPPLAPERTVVIVHDLAFKYFPEAYSVMERQLQARALGHTVRTAKHIICISRSTERDLHKFYDFPESRTSVVYPGWDKNRFYQNRKKSSASDYILFVGRLEERKNVAAVVQAYRRYRQQSQRQIKLVLAGRPGYGFGRIEKEIVLLGPLRKDVILMNYVEGEKLPELYAGAKLFLFPSLYEGFGLPVLEAFASGTPVITSNTSSLPEVAGDAALLVDPRNIDAVVGAMTEIIEDEAMQKELIGRGYKQCQKFSWDKTAGEVLAVLRSV
ncbi:MAG: glycosyltransferase family 1 protein [Patescibacteria group bacterium]